MKSRLVEGILWLLSKQGVPTVIPWAFGMIRSLYTDSPEDYFRFIKTQAERENWINQFFAAHEVGIVYSLDPDGVLSLLRDLSGSETEIVREGSAKSWSRILSEDFDRGFQALERLRETGSYEERYTAAIGPVEFVRDGEATLRQRQELLSYWNRFRDDPKQGLWNLVRTQILPEIEDSDGR